MKASCTSGFVIKSGDRAFDFHFSSYADEEDKKYYNRHHRLIFFSDVVTAMEEGIMTFEPQQPIKVVKEKKAAISRINKLEEELAIKSETIAKLTTEVEESKSPDTAIALYQKKYQEERQQSDRLT